MNILRPEKKDLVCYDGYFSRASKYEKLGTINIKELIKSKSNNSTPEEDELAAIQEKQRTQKVKDLRLQRKLSKNN